MTLQNNIESHLKNDRIKKNRLIFFKILPLICIILFAVSFVNLSNYSYCNLKGKLCKDPTIIVNDNTHEITTSCDVSDEKGMIEEERASKHLVRFTYVGLGLLAGLILIGNGIGLFMPIGSFTINIKDSIGQLILSISTLTIIAIIYILVNNRDIINDGQPGYGLSVGLVDILNIINGIYAIVLLFYVVFNIGIKNHMQIFKEDLSLIILIIIFGLQILTYHNFRSDCSNKYEYQCQSELNKVVSDLKVDKSKLGGQQKDKIDLINKYKVTCVATGIKKINAKLAQSIFGILALMAVLTETLVIKILINKSD